MTSRAGGITSGAYRGYALGLLQENNNDDDDEWIKFKQFEDEMNIRAYRGSISQGQSFRPEQRRLYGVEFDLYSYTPLPPISNISGHFGITSLDKMNHLLDLRRVGGFRSIFQSLALKVGKQRYWRDFHPEGLEQVGYFIHNLTLGITRMWLMLLCSFSCSCFCPP